MISEFTKTYKNNLKTLIDSISDRIILSIISSLEKCSENRGRIYVVGNGGSSATASHMVNDWGAGLKRRGIRNFDIECLSDNTTVCSALANDIGYDHIYDMQIRDKIREKDLLIAISCSGNSPNIINAVEYAKSQNTTVIGVSGFDGGLLNRMADIKFHVQTPKGQYGVVEDLHMILNHIIYTWFIENPEK